MGIAHDLHDGLGASLVRGMALLEQSQAPIPNERVLSLLKVMRDDLRQVIDYGSSGTALVPQTPIIWVAPLRHRFTRIFDELKVKCEWAIASQWHSPPSAQQCLAFTRVVEEALSNIIKHSRARHVRVEFSALQADQLVLTVEDDGIGFDVQSVQAGRSLRRHAQHGPADVAHRRNAGGRIGPKRNRGEGHTCGGKFLPMMSN